MRLRGISSFFVLSLILAFFLAACGGDDSTPVPTPVIDPPTADAGSDNTVEEGQTVTLDGSGSTAAAGAAITGYLWEQLSGPTATLSDNSVVSPTFTAPDVASAQELVFRLTVTDNTLQTASDNVVITVNWVGFVDNFSTDTTGDYTATVTGGTAASFTWDEAGERVRVLTGDDNVLLVSNTIPASDNGVFFLDFNPTADYPSHGGIWVRLRQDANNYYEISNFDWSRTGGIPSVGSPDVAVVKKVVGGVQDNVAIPTAYTQGGTFNIKITFSATQVILEGFGDAVTWNTADTTAISATTFEIEAGQQDAYYDNIKLLAHP